MEEVKNNKPDSKKSKLSQRGADFGTKILSVIIAVIVWFVLSITQYPTINKTITGVPVDFSMEGTKAQEKGLDALNYSDITVDVEIKGMNYEIGSYTANDLTATVNLDEVTKEGTYVLDINVKSSHATDKCTVVSVTPETVEVEFDRITTKTVELSVEAPLVSAEEGYTLKESSVEPAEITVEGAKNDLDRISKAAVQITKSKKISEDTTITSDNIIFYDEDDNVIDSSKFTVNQSAYSVNFVVYKKKQLNLKVDITGCPDGFDTSTLPIVMSEESVSVITPNLDDPDSEDVTVGSIALSNISPSRSFTFAVPVNTGDINVAGEESVIVSFSSEDYTSKSFTVNSSRIKLKNKPSGYTVTKDTKKLTSVTVYGPTDVIDSLTDEDIYAEVDLSDVYEAGSYTREATVYAKGYDNVWCYGTNSVQVVVTDPATTTTTTTTTTAAAD